MSNFQEKSIIITGAAMGLGLAAAKELAGRGATLVLVDYNQETLTQAQQEIAALAPQARLVKVIADVSQEAAVRHYVEEATKAFGRIDGLYNNAIAPGAILTPMVAAAFQQVNPADPKQAETEYAQRNPTKRLGLPEEVAKVVAFLLSEEASCLNGQTIAIDGGESNMYGNS